MGVSPVSDRSIEVRGRGEGLLIERLPLPYPLVIVLVGLLGLVEQIVEYSLRDPGLRHMTLDLAARRLILPALIVFIMVMLHLLRESAVRALRELRPVVQVSDEEYWLRGRQMVRADTRLDLVLLAVAVVVSILWFVVARFPLPFGGKVPLPRDGSGVFILLVYLGFGWSVLVLVYRTLQLGAGLGRLARYPLVINIFDPTYLLPFGRLALVHSLPPLGLVFILVIELGQPTAVLEWAIVIMATLASTLALIVPIWGVHHQIVRARVAALLQIHEELRDMQAALVFDRDLDKDGVVELNNRISALSSLRKTIQESPTWPFRTAAVAARAMLVTLSPLIYFVLNEMIRTYVFPFFK